MSARTGKIWQIRYLIVVDGGKNGNAKTTAKKTTTPAAIPTWENRQLDQKKTKQKPTPHMDEGKRVWLIFQKKSEPAFYTSHNL